MAKTHYFIFFIGWERTRTVNLGVSLYIEDKTNKQTFIRLWQPWTKAGLHWLTMWKVHHHFS